MIRRAFGVLLTLVVPAGIAVPAGAVPVSAASAPCLEIPGVSDRCPLWRATYDHPGGYGGFGYDEPMASALGGGRVFVTGRSVDDATGTYDIATVAFDADTGARLWVARFDGDEHAHDTGWDVAVNAGGTTVFVTGAQNLTYPEYPSGSGSAVTLAYDTVSGSELWRAVYAGPGSIGSAGTAIVVANDGSQVILAGTASREWAGIPTQDFLTVAYDAATGTQRWAARYDGPARYQDYASGAVMSPDGRRVFVTGSSWGAESYDYLTIAYDTGSVDGGGGDRSWVARNDGPGGDNDYATSVAIDPSGGQVVVTGASFRRSAVVSLDVEYATLAYDAATGSRRWSARHLGQGGGLNLPASVVASADGVFVTGQGTGAVGSDADAVTVAYAGTTGSRSWVAHEGLPGSLCDAATAATLSADGARLYVTGADSTCGDSRQMLFAYDTPTGSVAWRSRGGGERQTGDMVIGRDVHTAGDRVFVVGTQARTADAANPSLFGPGNYRDYVVTAYQA